MTVAEVMKDHEGEYDISEVYGYRGKIHRLHTDFVYGMDMDDIDPETAEVDDYEIMDEDVYNHTILANDSLTFSDFFEDGQLILVMVINDD